MKESIEVLDPIPVEITADEILGRMRIRKINPDLESMVGRIVKQAEKISRPKGVFRISFIEKCSDETVSIDGIVFTSRILAVNFKDVHRVFPFVVTAGMELETLKPGKDRFIEEYVIDVVKEHILSKAREHLVHYITDKYKITKYGYIEPGSLSSWPVEQQKELFQLLGDVEKMIGVKLTESFMMRPIKSVSGILFPTEIDFQTCMLCPREKCPERKAPYNPEMLEKYSLK